MQMTFFFTEEKEKKKEANFKKGRKKD